MSEATLGSLIRARRLELGLRQEQLAARIGGGVRQSEVSRLERDRVTPPRRERFVRTTAALDLPLGQMLAASGREGFQTPRAFLSGAERTELRARAAVGGLHRARERLRQTHQETEVVLAAIRVQRERRAAGDGRSCW
jgi:transcriptional regulator with XRE-family HTH domain